MACHGLQWAIFAAGVIGVMSKGGKSAKEKGSRLERLIVGIFSESGIEARRMPLSGSVEGFGGDVRLKINGSELTGECKSRAASFGNLYRWIKGYDFLALKRDRDEALIVIEARKLASILGGIASNRIEKAMDASVVEPSKPPGQPLSSTTEHLVENKDSNRIVFQSGKPSIRF